MYPQDLARIIAEIDPNATVHFDGQSVSIGATLNIQKIYEALRPYVIPPTTLDDFAKLNDLFGELSPDLYHFYDGDRLPDGVLEALDDVAQKLVGFRKVESVSTSYAFDIRVPEEENTTNPHPHGLLKDDALQDTVRRHADKARYFAEKASTEIREIVIGLTDYRAPDITETERQYRLENYSRLIRSVRPDKEPAEEMNVKGPDPYPSGHQCGPDCPLNGNGYPKHVCGLACAFGAPDCPEFASPPPKKPSLYSRFIERLNQL